MRCFFCRKDITVAMRTFVRARNRREKDNFRDLCYECYCKLRKDSTPKGGGVLEEETRGSVSPAPCIAPGGQ